MSFLTTPPYSQLIHNHDAEVYTPLAYCSVEEQATVCFKRILEHIFLFFHLWHNMISFVVPYLAQTSER